MTNVKPQKVAVWLWDEVGAEWGPAYVEPEAVTLGHKVVHLRAMDFIDYMVDSSEEEIVYQVDAPGLSINVGWWSRHHLFVEMWGPDAEKVIAHLKENWEPDDAWYPGSTYEAIRDLMSVHDLVR